MEYFCFPISPTRRSLFRFLEEIFKFWNYSFSKIYLTGWIPPLFLSAWGSFSFSISLMVSSLTHLLSYFLLSLETDTEGGKMRKMLADFKEKRKGFFFAYKRDSLIFVSHVKGMTAKEKSFVCLEKTLQESQFS